MSIDRCSKCGTLVDTDDDTKFYGENGDGFGAWESLCENCREELDAGLYDPVKDGWVGRDGRP